MTDSTSPTETHNSYPVGPLITTGIVSAIAAFSAALLWFHFFPQQPRNPLPKLAVVDLIKLSASVAKLNALGNPTSFEEATAAVSRLKDQGFIVLDARAVITAPEELIRKPSQLVPGAPDFVGFPEFPDRPNSNANTTGNPGK